MPNAELGDLSLHYKEHGEGPPCLGVMGFALDQRFWASTIPAVTGTHKFIVFDNRGIGRSTGELPNSIEEMADDSVRLLDHLGIEKTVLFGVSMGGTIAQRIALAHPDRISALILGITWARPIEFMRRQSEIARETVKALGPDSLVSVSLVRMFSPQFFEIGRDTVDRMIAAFFAESGPDQAGSEVLLAQLDAIDKHDVLAELGSITCPTLVFGGKMDMMVPFFGSEEIAQAIPGAEFEAFETGHGCMVEEMTTVNERIARFLAQQL